jgi:hypothetical protein
VSAYQQAITKYQNKPRTKPKKDCGLLALTKMDSLTLKTKKTKIKGG